MKNAQAEFDRELEERTEFKSNIPKSEAQQACRKIESTCKLLFKYLDVMTEIDSTEELTIMINQINVVIKELTTAIHIRKSKKREEKKGHRPKINNLFRNQFCGEVFLYKSFNNVLNYQE